MIVIADRYWVGGTGNWSDYNNHWSATSGGAPGASKPTLADNVYFNADSFNATGQTVTLNENAYCLSMDWTGATNTPTFAQSRTITIYGSLTFIANMLMTSNFGIYLVGSGTINTNGLVIPTSIYITDSPEDVPSNYALQNDLTCTGSFYVSYCTFDTGNYDITTPTFDTANLYTRTLTLGSSTITCSSSFKIDTYGLTFDAGTSLIKLTGDTSVFSNGGSTSAVYNNVEFAGAVTTVIGPNTFNNLKFTAGKTVLFTAGSTQNVTTLTAIGTSGSLITMESTSSGSHAHITITSGTVLVDYCSIKDSVVSGGATFIAKNSTNVSGNTGWLFLPSIDVQGKDYVGSIAGANYGTIEKCAVSGTIVGVNYVGGLIGVNYDTGTINKCTIAGTVYGTTEYIGGLVGAQLGTINNSYSTAAVVGGTSLLGGFAGDNNSVDAAPGTIENCYSTGLITTGATTNVGGFIGNNHTGVVGSEGVVTSCYYDTTTSGQSDTGKGTPTTTANMKLEATFVAWDFADIWAIDADYPTLQAYASLYGFESIKSSLNATAQTHFETCANYMVAFNGVNAPWKYDGTNVTALANAPAKGKFAVLHKEQLFTVDTDTPSTLEWSAPTDPETWPGLNVVDIKQGDGDTITNIQKFLGELTIFKRRSLHTLRGTDIDDFRLDELDTRIGCVGGFAAIVKGPYIFFVSDEGLCAFNGMSVINLSDIKIPGLWSNINTTYLSKAVVGYWDGYIWFALPEVGYTYNNLVVLYELPLEGVVDGKFWPCRGITASCFTTYNSDNLLSFYAGDATSGGFIRRQWVGTDDDGVAIDAYWVGKHFNVGMPEHLKKAKKVFITDSQDTPNTVTLSLSFDYGAYTATTLSATDNLVRQFKTERTDKFRYVSPKIVHNALGTCEVRGIMIPCKVKLKPKVVGV